MKVLLCGAFHRFGMISYYEAAFRGLGAEVTYCGLPYGFERPGYAPDLDLAEAARRGTWDLLFYIDEWKPVFPLGLPQLPFPTAGYFPDAGFDLAKARQMAPFFDCIFLSTRWVVEKLKPLNPNTFYLPFGYDPERMRHSPGEPLYEVAFVGKAVKDREPLLRQIAGRFRMNDYTQRASPEELSSIYSRSKIVFNKPPQKGRDHNMRVFEAMGCGSLLITEHLPEEPLFGPGEFFVTYRGERDLMEKIRHYLDHEEERKTIALRGQKEVLSRHTYVHRAQAVLDQVRQSASGARAPARRWGPDRVFLSYQKVFGRLMMLEEATRLFSTRSVSLSARLKMLPVFFASLLRRARRLGWRRFAGK